MLINFQLVFCTGNETIAALFPSQQSYAKHLQMWRFKSGSVLTGFDTVKVQRHCLKRNLRLRTLVVLLVPV